MTDPSPKQRMLNAYRGLPNDRPPVAPEFWCYYPARVLGLDMIEFSRRVPFHLALKTTFEKFGADGWCCAGAGAPNGDVTVTTSEERAGPDQLVVRRTHRTPAGSLTSADLLDRHEPSWRIERPIKDVPRDLPAYEALTMGGDWSAFDGKGLTAAWREVGESCLLEAVIGVPFFDYYAEAREGGFEQGIVDFHTPDLLPTLEGLRERYMRHMVTKTAAICEKTPLESLFIGCSWSCNSLIGPHMWRRWDKPVIAAVVAEAHRHGRLVHVHFHGRCMETVADLAELGIDCVCPFERPPGGDVAGAGGLRAVERILRGGTTFNGNIHTVETLIRGRPGDVRREVREVLDAFAGNPRVIVGTGDQVGRETPEENIHAMVDAVKTAGNRRRSGSEWSGTCSR